MDMDRYDKEAWLSVFCLCLIKIDPSFKALYRYVMSVTITYSRIYPSKAANENVFSLGNFRMGESNKEDGKRKTFS